MANNKIMRFVVSAVVLVALMTLTAFAADITGGFGAIGGVDDTYYAAPATLNAKGNALELGEAIQLTDANNTGLAGLYAVSTDSTFEGDYEIVYVYGDMADRQAITESNTYVGGGDLTDTDNGSGYGTTYPNNPVKIDGTKTYVVGVDENPKDGIDDHIGKRVYSVGSGETAYLRVWGWSILQVDILESTETFAPGYFTGKGGWTNRAWGNWAGYPYAIGQIGSHISKANQSNWESADDTKKQEILNNIKTTAKLYNLKYAFTAEEIVKIGEVNKYNYSIERRGGTFSNKNHVVLFEALVADENGKVTPYPYSHNAITLDGNRVELIVDFKNAGSNGKWDNGLPTTGYLVGFVIWPYHGIDNIQDFSATTTNSAGDVRLYHGAIDSKNKYTCSYSIDTPKASKPTGLGVDENGALTGTVPGMTYEYANLNDTSRLKEFAETGVVSTALTYATIGDTTVIGAGLYAVRVAGVTGEYDASDIAILYVEGSSVDNIMHYDDSGLVLDDGAIYSSGGWRTANKNRDVRVFNKGVWSGALYPQTTYKYVADYQHNLFNSGDNNLTNWASKQYYNGPEGTNTDTSNGIDYDTFVHAVESEYTTYQYEDDEIIPFSNFASYTYKTNAFKTQITASGDVYTKFIFYVVTENGNLEAREWTQVMDFTGSLQSHTVKASDFLDTTGYIVAMEIHPTGYVPDTTTLSGSATNDRTSYCVTLVPNGYVLKTAHETPEVAVVGDNYYKATLEVSNFEEGLTYAYSIDEGATWTNFTTDTVKLTKANVAPWVKVLADSTHFESEIGKSQTSSSMVVSTGMSLVLDGQIGMRFYFDVDTTKTTAWTQWNAKLSNKDTGTDLTPIKQYRFAPGNSGDGFATFMEDGRTAYVTIYVPAKDFDNAYLTTSNFLVFENGVSAYTANLITMIPNSAEYSVAKFIASFDKQVEAGNEECIAAKDLVDALKAYCENADTYFNTEAEALGTVVADTTAINTIADPSKSGKFTYGDDTILEHYSTSLILEENVTIRHYFKATAVEGQPTFTTETVTATETNGKAVAFDPANYKASTTTDGVCYYYVDITDIDAKNLDTQYELKLTLKPSEDAEEQVITVKYSALNYVKQSYNDSNAKLANLVKALYNYSAEAEAYVK